MKPDLVNQHPGRRRTRSQPAEQNRVESGIFAGMANEKTAAVGLNVSHEMLRLIAEIDEFKGRWEALKTLSPERLRELRHEATIESIGSSTRIEGARLTDQQIETLLSNLQRDAFKSRDDQEVAGYAEAMDLLFQSWKELTLTENHLKQLHAVMLKYSAKDDYHRGQYKRTQNDVVAYDRDGKEIGVIFETTSPFQTPLEMQQLVEWTSRATTEKMLHPLLVIAVFVVRFLAIHPFQDGNGRLSRILTTLLLLRGGYDYVPYASLERVIEENKDQYYTALRKTQGTLKQAQTNWEAWIIFFLRCLKKQRDNLSDKLQREHILAPALPPLAVTILKLLREHKRLTISELEQLTGANKNTLKVRLRELTQSQQIAKQGQARATWYALM